MVSPSLGRRLRRIGLVLAGLLLAVTGAVPAHATDTLRVATYNVLALNWGSSAYTSLVDVVTRMDADVVMLQEITGSTDVAHVADLAAACGYGYSYVGDISGTLSGGLRNGLLSRYPIVNSTSWSAAELSGDPAANDITRDIVEVELAVPDVCGPVVLVTMHFKSASGSTNLFRRAVEHHRVQQVIANRLAAQPDALVFFGGDFNDSIEDGPFGTVFNSLPSGLPGSFKLGSDIAFPVVHDPFVQAAALGLVLAEPRHEDAPAVAGTYISSGNRLDYVFGPAAATLLGDEVYSSVDDDGVDGGPIGDILWKAGAALPAAASETASDHWSVFTDWLLEGCDGSRFGTGSPASRALVPRAGLLGPAAVGTPGFGIRLLYATPGAPALLVLSVQKLAPPSGLPTDPYVPGGSLFVDVTTSIGLFPATADAHGRATFSLPIPNKAALVGFELDAQWFVEDAGSANGVGAMSDALEIVLH